jgi:MmyB-like transcription regulator ligand binding domain
MESIVADIESYRWAHIGWVHLAIARYPDDPRLAHLAERLQRIPEARRMCDAQHVARFTEGVIPVRFRPAGPSQVAEADVLSTEVPGGYRLMMIVPRGGGLAGQARPGGSPAAATG